jgi:lysophospholipase L1-like esterase
MLAFAVAFSAMSAVHGQPWVLMDSHTRYAALGDSVAAGYGALPATQAYPYQLYQSGVIDNINNTLFSMMAVPGAMTSDVLYYQIPQLGRFLHHTGMPYRQVVTLQIGANDMFQVMAGAEPTAVLTAIGGNLYAIIGKLTTDFPNAKIYVGKLF